MATTLTKPTQHPKRQQMRYSSHTSNYITLLPPGEVIEEKSLKWELMLPN